MATGPGIRKELVTMVLYIRKETAINTCNAQQAKLKTAPNYKVLCNMNLEDNYVKIDRGGQLSKGRNFDCEIDKQTKNETYARAVCVKQNCEAGVKDLSSQCGEKYG